MGHLAVLLVSILVTPHAAAKHDKDAKAVAQDLLNKGSALFDGRDAAVMAETYADNARLTWVERDRDTGKYKFETREGRAEIEKLYRDLFKDSNERTTSKNTVEYAKFIASDLLVIQGEFEPKVNEGKWNFIQERVKQGDRWLIQSLRIYIISPN